MAYFYCSFNTLDSQQPVNILASFLVQLCSEDSTLFNELSQAFLASKEKGHSRTLEVRDLLAIFTRNVAQFSRVFLFVDAVNESEAPSAVTETLLAIAQSCNNVRFLITSTDNVNRHQFSQDISVIESNMSKIDADILTYVNNAVDTNVNLRTLSVALKSEVREAISGRASGVYVQSHLPLPLLNS